MSKSIICCGEQNDYYHGIGDNAKKAYEDYKINDGEDSFLECRFFEANELEVDLVIRKQEPVGKTTK